MTTVGKVTRVRRTDEDDLRDARERIEKCKAALERAQEQERAILARVAEKIAALTKITQG